MESERGEWNRHLAVYLEKRGKGKGLEDFSRERCLV